MPFQYKVEVLGNGKVLFTVPIQGQEQGEADAEAWKSLKDENKALLRANLGASIRALEIMPYGKRFQGNRASNLKHFKTDGDYTNPLLPSAADLKARVLHRFTVEQQTLSDGGQNKMTLNMDLSGYDEENEQLALELIHAYGKELRWRYEYDKKYNKKDFDLSINLTGPQAQSALDKYQQKKKRAIRSDIENDRHDASEAIADGLLLVIGWGVGLFLVFGFPFVLIALGLSGGVLIAAVLVTLSFTLGVIGSLILQEDILLNIIEGFEEMMKALGDKIFGVSDAMVEKRYNKEAPQVYVSDSNKIKSEIAEIPADFSISVVEDERQTVEQLYIESTVPSEALQPLADKVESNVAESKIAQIGVEASTPVIPNVPVVTDVKTVEGSSPVGSRDATASTDKSQLENTKDVAKRPGTKFDETLAFWKDREKSAVQAAKTDKTPGKKNR